MTDGTPRGRVRLGELIDASLAATDPAAHAGFVADLAAVTRSADTTAAVTNRLLAEGERGARVFVEWLAQLRVRVPEAVLLRVPPTLAGASIPEPVRARAAARAIRSSHDRKAFLAVLVPHLTAGRSPLEALVILRQVQSLVRRSAALDAVIARRERRLKLACPRCSARLGRAALAAHLYEVHNLVLDEGRAVSPGRIAQAVRKRYAAGRDTTLLDRAAQLGGRAALRRWAARTGATAADVRPLCGGAAERGHGLCPRCLGELPPSVPPLPPPLTLAGGRLTGEGYSVRVGGWGGLRAYAVETPAGVIRAGLDGRRAIGPRVFGTLAAGAVIATAIGGAGLGFGGRPSAAGLTILTIGIGAAYLGARFVRPPLPPVEERAVERAWSTLPPRLSVGPVRDRFLTRLCRVSAGVGDPEARAALLARIRAEARTPGLRAAVGFLQRDDAGRLGADRVAGVGELIAAGFRGDETLDYAEHAAELFLTRDPPPSAADRARLRVLALDAAFVAGYSPRALVELWAACPALRRLMAVVPLSRLGLQYAVWSWKENPPWDGLDGSGTVFELARVAPTLGGRLLAAHPDLLLYVRPPAPIEEALGWVLVCARGVVIGDRLVADPDAEVRAETGAFGGRATLVFGPHRLTLPKQPLRPFVLALQQLLRLRSDLLPLLDTALAPGAVPPAASGLARRCSCGARVLTAVGEVGRAARVKPG
jgi:hypothetical protein